MSTTTKVSASHLAGILNSLLPLPRRYSSPHGYISLSTSDAIREWLKVKFPRLIWNEISEKYVLNNFRILSNIPPKSSCKQFKIEGQYKIWLFDFNAMQPNSTFPYCSPRPSHQELTLTLAAPDCNPILLTPTFLQGSGIIPDDWQLARQPHLTPPTRPNRLHQLMTDDC